MIFTGYRLDVDGEFFTFVPTATRDANGFVVAAVPLLDRRVTIPLGNRRVSESAKLMADSLSAQTGLRVSCCQAMVAGIPWGMSSGQFEAHNETARNVVERLLRLESSPPRDYWLLRCDFRYRPGLRAKTVLPGLVPKSCRRSKMPPSATGNPSRSGCASWPFGRP